HLAQQRIHSRRLAGKTDAQQPTHRAAAAVAADEIARTQPRSIGQHGGYPVLVLIQADQFAMAPHLGAEVDGVLSQPTQGDCLTGAEYICVRSVEPVRLWLADAGEETAERILPAEREELGEQTALVHHLDSARVNAKGPNNLGWLRLLLQNKHAHTL